MTPRLPEYLDFIQLSSRGRKVSGSWPVAELERLNTKIMNENSMDDSNQIYAELNFGQTGNINYLKGFVTADLSMICQRCLEQMKLSVNSTFNFCLKASDARIINSLEEYDPLIIDSNNNSVIKIIEDELLLSLPIVSVHDEQCSDFLKSQNKHNVPGNKKENPFSELKDLIT